MNRQFGFIHDTGCLGLVHWDDPEGWYGEGGGRRVQDGEHVYTRADSRWYMAKPIQYCKVKINTHTILYWFQVFRTEIFKNTIYNSTKK